MQSTFGLSRTTVNKEDNSYFVNTVLKYCDNVPGKSVVCFDGSLKLAIYYVGLANKIQLALSII